ncbi:MAG: FG-GAP-like repeat-containing protein [Acidobacteriaceae bacterium]
MTANVRVRRLMGWKRVGCGVVVLLLAGWSPAHAQTKAAVKHGAAKPMLMGTDGSMTGTANFQGNMTTMSAPGGDVVSLFRQPNCSLTFADTNYSLQTGSNDSLSGTIEDGYELVLHTEAGLTTKPDVFASGCVPPTTGFGSAPIVYVGATTSAVSVVAGIGYDSIAMGNGLYIGTSTLSTGSDLPTGNVSTNYALSVFGLSTANVLTTADLNKDGNNDLVVSNSVLTTSGSVSVLLGKDDGTFQDAVSYPTVGAGTVAAVIDDVNGDGKLDIVTVSSAMGASGGVTQQISVLLGKGDGTFGAAQSFNVPALPGNAVEYSTPIVNLITADLRGDGKKDLIASNGEVFLGNGDGTFTALATPAFPYTTDSMSATGPYLASGDLNKDGKLDLVVGDGSAISTYLGKGDGTFTVGSSYASIANDGEVTVSDLDGDGNPDIYTGIANGGAYSGDEDAPNLSYALMGYGNGTMAGASEVPSGGAYNGTNLGDVNGDGIPDLITNGTVNQQTAAFSVQLNNGKGGFTTAATVSAPVSFMLNGNTFTNASTTVATTYAVADINGDGKADLVWVDNELNETTNGNLNTDPYAVYFTAISNGDGTFQTPVAHAFPQIAAASGFDIRLTVTGLEIADFNHDGNNDLIFTYNETGGGPGVTNAYNQGLAVLLGTGGGSFSTTAVLTPTYGSNTAPTTSLVPEVLGTPDLNNDNKPDLVVNNSTFSVATGSVSEVETFIGKGDGTFKAPVAIVSANQYGIPVLEDFNKDGKLDIAFIAETNASQGELVTALGNGDGTFATPAVMNLTGGDAVRSDALAAADFDGDGHVDLAMFDNSDYSGIFYGKGDGTFTSVPGSGYVVPKDLINLAATNGEPAIAVDLNGDGKPDILAGPTVLLNTYGQTTTLVGSTTGLSASASAIKVGASVKFTATVMGASGSTGTPTGTVTFYDGTTMLGTGTLATGAATYTTTGLPVGSDSITATYGGDANFSGSTSSAVVVAVSAATTPIGTSTALSASASSAVSGTTITFTATVKQASGTTVPGGSVTFLDGTTTLGTGSLNGLGVATYAASTLAVGTHSITATYGGATGFTGSTSTAVSVSITAAVTPSYALSISPGSGSVAAGSGTSATISVTPAGGFSAAVSLACTGAPANATCSASPTSVTPNGSTASTATLMIETSVAVMAANRSSLPGERGQPGVLLSGAALLGWTLLRRRRRNWWWAQLGMALVLVAAGAVTGCGGSGSGANKTPAGTYSLTVTGTSGTTTETASYSLTVK